MYKSLLLAASIATAAVPGALACGDSCYGPASDDVQYVRQVKRMQPGAMQAINRPTRSLEWGQLNFLHTTDTHGWLQGHLKEKNYGADWGDFVTFSRRMNQTAGNLGVDLLLVDTGDLHDGTGLSDATTPDGAKSMPIFDEIQYDLLTIGNHELYVSEIAYQMFDVWSKKWGDRYVTSNVKIFNQKTGQYEYPGVTHRYFQTPKGLRIMAFGVLFDFTGNSNASKVIKAEDMVKEIWFTKALASENPIDTFVLLGHNPIRTNDSVSTFKTVIDTIRMYHPRTPIEVLGGHTHIRDFVVYDENAVGMESGRYCETLGWLSMSGFNSSNSAYTGIDDPKGVPNPSRPAVDGATSPFVFSRRYMDWNRKTFMYHVSQPEDRYDYHSGQCVSHDITRIREELKLGQVYGCAPGDYCISCAPFDDKDNNIFPAVIYPAVSAVVLNETRKNESRIIVGNTGAIRFDLHKGPFTWDDNFIVAPFRDTFLYIADVPFDQASDVINRLNRGTVDKRSGTSLPPDHDCTHPNVHGLTADKSSGASLTPNHECMRSKDHQRQIDRRSTAPRPQDHDCTNPKLRPKPRLDKRSNVPRPLNENGSTTSKHDTNNNMKHSTMDTTTLGLLNMEEFRAFHSPIRRQEVVTPGYVTEDDFGTDGDDTMHSKIPNYPIPGYWEARASFPSNGSNPEKVDLIFFDFIKKYVLDILGSEYTAEMVQPYINSSFTSQDFMLPYAKMAWQDNIDNCPI